MNKTMQILKATIALTVALAFLLPGAALADTRTLDKKAALTTPDFVSSQAPYQPTGTQLFEDDFESYDDFVLDFPPWTQYDGDGFGTWGFETYDFENEYYVGSFIIFVPSQCVPPLDDPPHSGEKYAACFDGEPTDPNDDWMITPQLSTSVGDVYVGIHCVNHDSFWLGIDDFVVTDTGSGIEISFWAKTGSAQYEPDRFQVGVSPTDNNPGSFYIISEEPYVEPPTTWTQYTYEWSEIPEEPELEIGEITGGFGKIKSSIKNIGNGAATDVEWGITLDGGLIILGANTTGSEATIDVDGEAAVESGFIFGIGRPTITVYAECAEGASDDKTASAFVLLFLILNVA
jgi:hypothetical protein